METLQAKLRQLTRNLWWTWRPEVRAIFRDLDMDIYRKAHRNPVRVIKEHQPGHPGEAGRGGGHPHPHRPGPAPAERVPEPPDHLGHGPRRHPAVPARGLLLRRVRHPRVHPHLLRRPGHPGRRPPEGRLQPGRAPGGRGPALPPGLHHPGAGRQLLAARRERAVRFRRPAPGSRPGPGRQARCGSAWSCPGAPSGPRCWKPRWGGSG